MAVGNPTGWARTVTFNKVAHSWNAVTGADGYRLYRKPDADVSAVYVEVWDGTAVSWDEDVASYDLSAFGSEPLAAYDWKLVAYDTDGESSGTEATETMTGIVQTDVDNQDIAHPTYLDGGTQTASYTITNGGSETSGLDEHTKSLVQQKYTATGTFTNAAAL